MRRHLSSCLAAALLLAFLHAPLAAAQLPPWLLCDDGGGNYTANSTFQSNIERLSATLPGDTSSSSALFATATVGAVPNIVYALALCRGDAVASANASDACATCVATAFEDGQRLCAPRKDAIVFYDACPLRFSNRDFLANHDNFVDTYILSSAQKVNARAAVAFDAAVGLLVNATADYAAAESPKRFGTGHEDFDNKSIPAIYALAQCTPDMAPRDCRSCLADIIGLMPTYFSGRQGGRILGVRCNYRYEVYPFFSGQPLLQLPAPTSPLAPAPVPANVTPPPATGDYMCTKEDAYIIEYLKSAPEKRVLVNIDSAWLNRKDMECMFHDNMQLDGEVLRASTS